MHRLGAVLVGLAAVLAVSACGTGGLSEGGNRTRGKELFVSGTGGKQSCSSCHALEDAGSTAQVGPNLDAAFGPGRHEGMKESTIAQIVKDQIEFPAEGTGMPAKLVEGDDANDVAAYVAAVAGKNAIEPQAGAGSGAIGKADGKSIFASAGCGSCHTLKDAGTKGTTGPNLDQLKPSREAVVRQVTNGGGAMPAFKNQLKPAQIAAVAAYVSQAAGK